MPCYNCCCTYKVTTNSNCNSKVTQVIYLQHLEQSVSAKYHCKRAMFLFFFSMALSWLKILFFFFHSPESKKGQNDNKESTEKNLS